MFSKFISNLGVDYNPIAEKPKSVIRIRFKDVEFERQKCSQGNCQASNQGDFKQSTILQQNMKDLSPIKMAKNQSQKNLTTLAQFPFFGSQRTSISDASSFGRIEKYRNSIQISMATQNRILRNNSEQLLLLSQQNQRSRKNHSQQCQKISIIKEKAEFQSNNEQSRQLTATTFQNNRERSEEHLDVKMKSIILPSAVSGSSNNKYITSSQKNSRNNKQNQDLYQTQTYHNGKTKFGGTFLNNIEKQFSTSIANPVSGHTAQIQSKKDSLIEQNRQRRRNIMMKFFPKEYKFLQQQPKLNEEYQMILDPKAIAKNFTFMRQETIESNAEQSSLTKTANIKTDQKLTKWNHLTDEALQIIKSLKSDSSETKKLFTKTKEQILNLNYNLIQVVPKPDVHFDLVEKKENYIKLGGLDHVFAKISLRHQPQPLYILAIKQIPKEFEFNMYISRKHRFPDFDNCEIRRKISIRYSFQKYNKYDFKLLEFKPQNISYLEPGKENKIEQKNSRQISKKFLVNEIGHSRIYKSKAIYYRKELQAKKNEINKKKMRTLGWKSLLILKQKLMFVRDNTQRRKESKELAMKQFYSTLKLLRVWSIYVKKFGFPKQIRDQRLTQQYNILITLIYQLLCVDHKYNIRCSNLIRSQIQLSVTRVKMIEKLWNKTCLAIQREFQRKKQKCKKDNQILKNLFLVTESFKQRAIKEYLLQCKRQYVIAINEWFEKLQKFHQNNQTYKTQNMIIHKMVTMRKDKMDQSSQHRKQESEDFNQIVVQELGSNDKLQQMKKENVKAASSFQKSATHISKDSINQSQQIIQHYMDNADEERVEDIDYELADDQITTKPKNKKGKSKFMTKNKNLSTTKLNIVSRKSLAIDTQSITESSGKMIYEQSTIDLNQTTTFSDLMNKRPKFIYIPTELIMNEIVLSCVNDYIQITGFINDDNNHNPLSNNKNNDDILNTDPDIDDVFSRVLITETINF
ncbi:UNKNOWN [Stylonychia lemnae]|uniref:Uncharacterized protein n=1 Tax=Stylonychia lemnae TaxID=5949 RepID=A0A077ZNA2_STYLE|nr:UNKNOWN [Stylonychia lemnae]|eukprot:CDW71398.1 UNKNOWN [Stylonychia lemnae]